MSWKESKVRVLTQQGGLQGLQVLSAENKKPSDIQDVFLLQSSNSSSNAVPQTSLPVSSFPSSSSHPSLASIKFKMPLPPSASTSSILPHQQHPQRQHSDKSLILHNLPSDVSCVPIISSNNTSPRVHQFQMQEKPPNISALLKHHPVPPGATAPTQHLEPQRSLHQISNYSPGSVKTEHPSIIELSQTVCNQLPRSTTLTPAVCVQQHPQLPLKEESTATLTLSSILPPSLSIIPTSTTNLSQSSTRLDSASSPQPRMVDSYEQIIGSTPSTELMPPPPPPPPQSHSRNTTSPSTSVSSTSEDGQERDIEFDGNDQVLCRVCGDKASGFHYGVHSCEGCKGFFRRSIQQKIQYRPCTKNQQCNILRINRNRCQYCRLKKCIAAGMSRDAVRFGRVPKREKAKILAAMQSSRQKTQESKIMTEMNDDSKIIETIVRAHYDTCDYTRNKIEPFIQKAKTNPSYISCSGSTCPMKGRSDDTFHEQFSERFMDHVRQVCTFAKLIPGFKCLHHDDQVTLLKSCVFEVLLVRLAGLFDNQALICLNGDLIQKDTITHMPPGNAKFLMDSVFGLALRMNQFGLSDAEIGLFCAVVIITADRPGLRNPELVHKMQSKLKSVLSNILLPQHPEHATMFSELMTMIHDLRTLNTLHTEKFLQQFKFGGGSSSTTSSDSAVSHNNQDGGSSDEGSQGSTDSSPTSKLVGQKRTWVGNEQDSTGNESPQSYTDTTSTGSVEDGCMNRRSPGMGSVSSSESVRSTEILKLTTNDLKVTGSALLNALATPTSVSSIAVAAAEVAARNPALAASTRTSASAPPLCPIMARRREVDPMCSDYSASKDVDNQKLEHQFMINNLKLLPLQPMSDAGSSSTAVALTSKSSTRTPPATASSANTLQQSETGGSKYKTQTRKLDSPSDSGIDSPKGAQGSTISTNTSVCSSPRNEEDKSSNSNLLVTSKIPDEEMKTETIEPVVSHTRTDSSSSDENSQQGTASKNPEEHQHPLLKRALEQPPQAFNPMMRGVATFQDEVYKPHKKFRRSNIPPSANIDECPSSTQTGTSEDRLSSPPPSSSRRSSSLLASQLAEAPKNYEPRLRSPPQAQPMSLLASTLRRETPLSTPEEAKRNEMLANLILEGNVPPLCPIDSEHQGLLMCATSRQDAAFPHQIKDNKSINTNASNLYTASSSSQEQNNTNNFPRRQLPPPTATITSQSSKSEPAADYRSGPYSSSDNPSDIGTRHIPVQQTPTKPQQHHSQSTVILGSSSSRSSTIATVGLLSSKDTPPHPEELSKLHSLAEAAASLSAVETNGDNDDSSSAVNGMDSQPLNLSTSRSTPSKQNIPTEA